MDHMKSSRAFTLIELLTVIAIIAILALLVAFVAGPFQRTAQMTQAMNNMKQLGAGLMNYTGSHDGQLPEPGSPQPGFGGGPTSNPDAWYNAVPKLAGARAVSDFTDSREFFKKSNLLYVPAGEYPPNPSRPLFAIALNSMLHAPDMPASAVRLANFGAASATIIFLETGLPGEDPLPGQNSGSYDGSSLGNPGNLAARYKRPGSNNPDELREAVTNLLFADGHAESLKVKDVMTATGTVYRPQLPQHGGLGKVCWTLDPEQ
jgi:prepilin-type N-terminal cleavage/methylation domain-containing protein/prepilin-type processing-associated H-X9-DG protein